MDFDKTTTDQLATLFPPNENEDWEFKDAAYLLKDKRQGLNNELATQASTFANTGGGHLVFGYADKSQAPQPCVETMGEEPTQDWLTKKIQQSVEPSLQAFSVHRISFTSDPSKAVFLIIFRDSPHAPHQSKADKKYYYRVGSSSEPAPHFYLELLRNRFTRADLEIKHVMFIPVVQRLAQRMTDNTYKAAARPFEILDSEIRLDFEILVANRSHVSAESWGVLYSSTSETCNWKNSRGHTLIVYGGCERSNGSAQLLPLESAKVFLSIYSHVVTDYADGSSDQKHRAKCLTEFCDLSLAFTPVSHNSVGQEYLWGKCDNPDSNEALKNNFIYKMRTLGHIVD